VVWPSFVVALQLANELFENAATMLVILKLIKTCARWRQKHDVSAVSHLSGKRNSTVQSSRAADRHVTFNLFCDFVRSASDEQCEYGFFSKCCTQLRVIAVFIFAAQDYDDPPRKCF